MKLLGANPSPYFRKCRMLLEEKGLDYEVELLSPFPKRPELYEVSPLGRIPVLQDGERRIPDSSVICAYLEKCHPEPALYPQDPAEYADALFLEEYADTQLANPCLGLQRERFLKPRLFQQPTDEELVQKLLDESLPQELGFLEARLPEQGWLLPSGFSIADAAVLGQLGGLGFGKVEIDAERWPKTAAYYAAGQARPSVQKAAERFS